MSELFDFPAKSWVWTQIDRTIGAVKRMYYDDCDISPSVWIETMFPAFLKGAYSVFEPDPKELYHKAFGQSLVGDIKQSIRDAQEMSGAEETLADRFVFRAAELSDMALWYLFLASVADQSLIDWSSMAMRMAGCKGARSRHSSDQPYGASTAPDYTSISNGFDWFTGVPHPPALTSVITVPPRTNFFIGWNCIVQDGLGNRVPSKARIICHETGTIYDEHQTDFAVGSRGAKTQVMYRGSNPESTTRTFGVQCAATIDLPHHECFPQSGFISLTLLPG